ncbi:MAG: DUF2442 domain-containing protein [Candidatus Limnocylindrales bacterium]
MNPPTIRNVRTEDDRLIFELDDERQVSLPVAVSRRLSQATAVQRDHWTIGPRGIFVHWPDVDEDMAIWDILGIREETYLAALDEIPVV